MVSVPTGLRGRVFLYYGEMRDRHGEPSTSFAHTAGYKAVRLRVRTEAGAVFTLRLGRPQVFSPRADRY